MSETPATLGLLMRSLRARNGWTLKEMSLKTGIPFSTLAKVEHDRLTLGYDKLMQISSRLKIRLSELLADPAEESESRGMTRRSVGTLETALRVDTPNYEYFFLCPDLRKKRMIPLIGRPRARTMEEFGELVRHDGEEFFYVLSGRVEVHTEFYEPVTLEVGQCVYIDSNMGHAYLLGAGCDDASGIGGCSSADDILINTLIKPLQNGGRESVRNGPDIVSRRPKKKLPRTKPRKH
jgi:transcriptional regulator with XRE-family HTH domain